mmetsp:Transcript_28504/g.70881  ORF Transcript_28504/g.70881 Transcript_28504/m.70881 type:complete len:214 (+) Transcript_28504:232-873(+)
MLTSLAIALAVAAESPVIMITRIPASRQREIEVATSGLAGSLMPTIPTKTRPRSTSSNLCGSLSIAPAGPRSSALCTLASAPRRFSFTASAKQRNGRSAIISNRSRSCARSFSFRATVRPSLSRRAQQRGSTLSGAPFTKSEFRPLSLLLQSTPIDLRERENSSVARRSYSAARMFVKWLAAASALVARGVLGMPIFSTRILRAASVGSPTRV